MLRAYTGIRQKGFRPGPGLRGEGETYSASVKREDLRGSHSVNRKGFRDRLWGRHTIYGFADWRAVRAEMLITFAWRIPIAKLWVRRSRGAHHWTVHLLSIGVGKRARCAGCGRWRRTFRMDNEVISNLRLCRACLRHFLMPARTAKGR